MKKYLIIVLALLFVAGIAVFFLLKRTPAAGYKTAKVERGPIVPVVSATGNLSAVITVQVGTQVSGSIKKLYVDYNSRVKKGEPIAEIDPALFIASVEQAEGNNLNAEANLQKAKANLVDAARTVERNKKLLAGGIISQGDYDVADTAWQSAKASLKAAEGGLAQARGALRQAKTNFNYSIIRSPVDGVVISRAVDVGQTVAASFQTPTLFTIAQDLTKMQIEVSVDEADISRIKREQSVTFTVDSYPEQSFKGKVVQVRSAPIITQNVVTYIVVVNVDNSDLKLKPGMTANVSIEVDHKDDVIKLPLAALRFRPASKDSAKSKSPAVATAKGKMARKTDKPQQIYILKDNKPVALPVKTGISDGAFIELLESSLKDGDIVVLEQIGDTKKKASGSPMGPRF